MRETSGAFAYFLVSTSTLTSLNYHVCDVEDPTAFVTDGGKFFVLGFDYERNEGPSSISKNIDYSNPVYGPSNSLGSFRDAIYDSVNDRYLVTTDFADGKLIEFVVRSGVTVIANTTVTGDFFDFAQSTL
jgi:hypothetical protein